MGCGRHWWKDKLIGMVMACIISCYRQVVAILELTKMFDDGKSCETVLVLSVATAHNGVFKGYIAFWSKGKILR